MINKIYFGSIHQLAVIIYNVIRYIYLYFRGAVCLPPVKQFCVARTCSSRMEQMGPSSK